MSTQAALEPEVDPAPAEAGPAIAPRAPRARRPRRRGRWVLLAVVVAVIVGWLAWASPVTLVKHVQVAAPRGISEDSIRLASGISAADHVPAVDAQKVRVAIMAAIPAVADVRVSRSLPDTIRLQVTARAPLAAVAAGKGYYVMDAGGVVYDKVASAKKLPVIKAGTQVGRDTARGVLLSLPAAVRRDVRQVTASTRDDVTLALDGGATVRWGSAEQADLKARVLAALLAVKADRYDVSSPLQPTTSGGPAATAPTTP